MPAVSSRHAAAKSSAICCAAMPAANESTIIVNGLLSIILNIS